MAWNKVGNIGASVNALYPAKVDTAATGGDTGTAVGDMADASGANAIAIGHGAVASAENAVAFGTTNSTANSIDAGNRRITNVADGTDDTDAMTVKQAAEAFTAYKQLFPYVGLHANNIIAALAGSKTVVSQDIPNVQSGSLVLSAYAFITAARIVGPNTSIAVDKALSSLSAYVDADLNNNKCYIAIENTSNTDMVVTVDTYVWLTIYTGQ